MTNFIENTLLKLWDAQVKPRNECTNSQDHIDRLEKRRSGRIVRAAVAGVLSIPLLVSPVLPSVISAVESLRASANDNPIHKDMIPVPQKNSIAKGSDQGTDALGKMAKTFSFILGVGFASFAFARANGARRDGKIIEQIKLDQESHYYLTGRTPV